MTRIAIAQMISSTNIEGNLKHVETYILQAKQESAALIVLPENFAFMGLYEQDKLTIAETYGQGPIQDKISQFARQYGIWIVAGTVPIKGEGSKVRASSLVYDEKGKCVARYDKIHLFDVRVSDEEAHEESNTIERGHDIVVVATPVGKMGLTVCYDLRFPELYHQLMRKGAELFAVPSAFTAVTGAAHWEVLLRARAIENLCYVVASNQGGTHENTRVTYGHSMVVEPWGKVVSELAHKSGVAICDIDIQRLYQLRRQFPCTNHHVLEGSL